MPDTSEGPWGSSDKGDYWSYTPNDAITRIEFFANRLTISSIRLITANESYIPDAQIRTDNFPDGFNINSPYEYLIGIKGASKYFPWYNGNDFTAITWLSFETNRQVYGPFGSSPAVAGFSGPQGGSIDFSYQAPSGSSIFGFQGRSGWTQKPDGENLYAIGVYVRPFPPPLPPPSPPPPAPPPSSPEPSPTPPPSQPPSPKPIFVKEWGGSYGARWDFQPTAAISLIVIYHSSVIHSLSFTSENGVGSGKIGAIIGGTASQIDINPGESITGIKGTFAQRGTYDMLTSLTFYASDGTVHGPYGEYFGTEFSLSVGGSIVGFHGRASAFVNAIGVYVKP